jgi:putative (di)nucleoside polyphosphate hydrolase|tara:strand:- start:631 stop:1119 length:489 start_codon:yes stop_codon:yes gene_type:complete
VIDADGYRSNVGIILANCDGQVLWARRVGQDAWQFPQGGMRSDETPKQAVLRELQEEIGLTQDNVEIMACTRGWLRYKLPRRLLRHNSTSFVGQKQKWFLLKMLATDQAVCVDRTSAPEFDSWCWVSYWYPLGQVVPFKKDVYRRAMQELAPALSKCVSYQD